jgi:hypothetical protein
MFTLNKKIEIWLSEGEAKAVLTGLLLAGVLITGGFLWVMLG